MNDLTTNPAQATNPATSKEFVTPTASARSAPRQTANVPRARILYVDDDRLLRQLCEQVLVGSGFDVDTAADGAEAWSILQAREYQLLITDNQMPRVTGLELIRKVRLARMSVPIILASGAPGTLPTGSLPWLECGAMLPKPFTAEQMLSAVHEVLRAAASPKSPVGGWLSVLEGFHTRIPQPHQSWGINE